MNKRRRLPLPSGTHAVESGEANGTRLVNLYVQALPPDSWTPYDLIATPGTSEFCHLPTLPVYGLHVMNDVLYAVTASALYRIEKNGAYSEIGPVDVSGNLSMANNGTDLVFVDGLKGFAFDLDLGEVKELTGDGWYPANTVTYQDGYFIFNRSGTGQFFISELLSTEFDALKFATAESSPDDTVAVISDHAELFLFGKHSVEFWYNSGDVDFTFDRKQGAIIERGINEPLTVQKMDNSVFWLAEDGIVYRANGYSPQRISNTAVERDTQEFNTDGAFAFTYSSLGHTFYFLTLPKINKTWCFDASTGEWHERSHYHHGRHLANCYAKAYERHFVGDFQNGMIYMLEDGAYSDDNTPISRELVTPPISSQGQRIMFGCVEIQMESGIGLKSRQDFEPEARLSWSDDGGKTYSNDHAMSIGKSGDFTKRLRWNRLGSSRQRQFKLVITDSVPVNIIAAYMEVSGGRS